LVDDAARGEERAEGVVDKFAAVVGAHGPNALASLVLEQREDAGKHLRDIRLGANWAYDSVARTVVQHRDKVAAAGH
jgi:hypothetical protein